MATRECSELTMPEEGMGTLMAQVTRQWVEKISRVIQGLRAKGANDASIFNALQQGLPDFDRHTLARIMALARNEPIEDDFAPEHIAGSSQPKPNTVVLKFHKAPQNIGHFSLVRHNDTDWVVLECDGLTWTLKLLD